MTVESKPPATSGSLLSIIRRLPHSLAELEKHPEAHRPATLNLVLDRAEELRYENPRFAMDVTLATIRLFDSIPLFFSKLEIREIRCRICLIAGGIQRSLANYPMAELSYECAFEDIRHDDLKPYLRLEHHARVALLRRDQRLFDSALDTAQSGLKLAQSQKDMIWTPRLRVVLANVLVTMGKYQRGLDTYYVALEELSPKDQNFHIAAVQSTAATMCFIKTSSSDQIETWLTRARRIEERQPNRIHWLHLQWLEALLRQKQGEVKEAETGLRQVMDHFLDLKMPSYSCVVAMDLALLLLSQGRMSEAKSLSIPLFSFLKDLRMHPDAIGALRLFIETAARSKLTTQVVEKVRECLIKSPALQKG